MEQRTRLPSFDPGDDAGLRKDSDVLGDVLLAGTELLGQFVDRHRPVAQGVEKADPHGLRDDAEALSDELDERPREADVAWGLSRSSVQLYSVIVVE